MLSRSLHIGFTGVLSVLKMAKINLPNFRPPFTDFATPKDSLGPARVIFS
jgi:hypothetical protein